MKRLAFIIAILMASGAMSACSQTEKGTETLADIKTSTSTATPSEVPESRIDKLLIFTENRYEGRFSDVASDKTLC